MDKDIKIKKTDTKRNLKKFAKFMTEEPGWVEERVIREEFFRGFTKPDDIDKIDDGKLRELILTLWSFNAWGNKDYILGEMLKSGLSEIKSKLKILLFDDDPIEKRFEEAKEIRMMGAGVVSEILNSVDPYKYAIWNKPAREGLIKLGVDENLFPRSVQISGKQYADYLKVVYTVRDKMVEFGEEFRDLTHLDFFLFYLFLQEPSEVKPPSRGEEDFDHNEAIGLLLELGDGLGFDVDREYSVSSGCRIDAIWKTRIANLGTISYAFEVHRKGSRDSAILNLQRVRSDRSIQKVIIVSTAEEISKFKEMIKTLDESFRKSVNYFEVNELYKAMDNLNGLRDILNKIGLMATETTLG